MPAVNEKSIFSVLKALVAASGLFFRGVNKKYKLYKI